MTTAETLESAADRESPPHRVCPLCALDNADAPALSASWRDWRLKACRRCGFVYLENPPPLDAFAVEHAWERSHGTRAVRMRREHPIAFALARAWRPVRRTLFRKPDKFANRIRAWVPPGPVYELGCGAADRLAALPPDWETHGIEISKGLAEVARANLAGRAGTVIEAPALEGLAGLPEGCASGVLMRSFLEHETRPVALLAEAWRVLRPGGCVIVKVPNFACINRRVMGVRWCGYRFPDHVNHFTPASLRAMVGDAGFEVVDFGLFARFPLSDNMWMVARRAA